MRYLGDDAALETGVKPVGPPARRRSRWSWLAPVFGGCWLLFIAGTSVYLLRREFYANGAKQLWCGAGSCTGLVRPPDDIYGVLLAVIAIGLFAALFAVPHRGSLRVARTAILAGLVAASWGAESLLFAPFFLWK